MLRKRLRALAAERRRFGYRLLHVLLRREGTQINHKKLRRIYREERLQVRRRGGRKRAFGTRANHFRSRPGQRVVRPLAKQIAVEDGRST